MASTSETGHAKNVANYEKIVTYCTSLATAYNPARASLKLPALQGQLASAKNVLSTLNSTYPVYSNAAAAREAAFEPFSKLVTRIINALKASDTTKPVIENAYTYVRKLQGRRATPKLTEEENAALKAEGKEKVQISASQMSYNSKIENFDKLVKLLASIPQYAPNEADLKVSALNSLLADLRAKNSAVIIALTNLTNARIARTEALYKPNTGIVSVSAAVKAYIKSLYGPSSVQYKALSGISLTNQK